MLTLDSLVTLARTAFDSPSLGSDSSSENEATWDSLTYLNLLSALSEATNGRSDDCADLARCRSIREVYEVLAANGLAHG
jgi:hypothetical protein